MNTLLRQGFLILWFAGTLSAQTDTSQSPANQTVDCTICHLCKKPTAEDPCLRECPRFRQMSVKAGQTEVPEVIVIDALSELYVPVIFSHKFHAEMSEMADGCSLCHHHNPSHTILSCRYCHPLSAVRADLSNPSLRGAYHRQCLGCHREWSHQTACSVCHALKSSQTVGTGTPDTTDIMGLPHPLIEEPEKIVFSSQNSDGPLITFYHEQHIRLFGLKCTQCHQKENCGKCHDPTGKSEVRQTKTGKPVALSRTDDQHHRDCNTCHKRNKCKFCHAKSERGPFNHYQRTGWNQNKYHANLKCEQCHKQRSVFSGLHRNCASCHKSWTPETFRHNLTGFQLDENHQEFDCEECHQKQNYINVPVCSNCHDETYVYPDKMPGRAKK